MMKPKTNCPKCQRDITNNNFTKHSVVCTGPKVKPPKSAAWYAAMSAKKSNNQYTKAEELGLPKPEFHLKDRRGNFTFKGRQHSQATRDKMSQTRIRLLEENPDKVPYKANHYSKGRSYPEQYWKEILDQNSIQYEEEYPISFYSLDFAIVDKKIDLEIDGEQHYVDQRIVESDIKRTKFLEDLGWKVIRIRWADYQKLVDKEAFVQYILSQL